MNTFWQNKKSYFKIGISIRHLSDIVLLKQFIIVELILSMELLGEIDEFGI